MVHKPNQNITRRVVNFHKKSDTMWQKIVVKVRKRMNTEVSDQNHHNRWKILERNYKEIVDNQNSTRGKRKCLAYLLKRSRFTLNFIINVCFKYILFLLIFISQSNFLIIDFAADFIKNSLYYNYYCEQVKNNYDVLTKKTTFDICCI